MKRIVLLFIPLILVFGCNSPGNNGKTAYEKEQTRIKYPLPGTSDSLLAILKITGDDTNKINVLNGLARCMELSGDYDNGNVYAEQAMKLSVKLNFEPGISSAYANLGNMFYHQGDYQKALENQEAALKIDQKRGNTSGVGKRLASIGNVKYSEGDYVTALDYYFRSLKIAVEQKNKKETSKRYSNIGLVYEEEGDYPKALDFYLKSLKLTAETKDKSTEAISLGNIGIVYADLGDTARALNYYFAALKVDDELGNKSGIIRQYGNIGNVYYNEENYPEAAYYDLKALEISRQIGDKRSEAINLGNLGSVYYKQWGKQRTASGKEATEQDESFKLALDYCFNAFKMNEEQGDKSSSAYNLANIGGIYFDVKNYSAACEYLYRSIAIADSIGAKSNEQSTYELLSELYEKSDIPLPDSIGGKIISMEQMRIRALHYFKSSVNLRDTLFSEENKKQLVQKEMNFEFDKKEASANAEQEKKNAIADAELAQKEKERNYFIVGFGVVILLAAFILRGYFQKRKANEIITLQKDLVEVKQKEILDSIHYARRIQKSLMPTEKYIQKNISRLKKE